MAVIQNKILLIGAGCLGTVVAARLAARHGVSCCDADAGRVRAVRRDGGVCVDGHRRLIRRVRMETCMSAYKGCVFDAVIVTVKCADVPAACAAVAKYCDVKRVLLLQNGAFALEPLADMFPGVSLCRGVTTMAVGRREDGAAEIFFRGRMWVGGHPEGARWFGRLFKQAGFDCAVVADYRGAVWAKLIFSAIMNPLPVILGRDYMSIRHDKEVYDMVCVAMAEGKAVARACGIRLAFDPVAMVKGIRSGKYGQLRHTGSMAADFTNGRPSEIEYMAGVITAEARRKDIRTPVLDTVLVLIRGMEKTRGIKR
ncbi:MAG: 2-dehydropantoate 2-reductase [Candidatus Omnitrophota bacterium]